MRPDPLDRIKPDHPVYLIGSVLGILVAALGLGMAISALRGWQLSYRSSPHAYEGQFTTIETFGIGIGVFVFGMIGLAFAQRLRRR